MARSLTTKESTEVWRLLTDVSTVVKHWGQKPLPYMQVPMPTSEAARWAAPDVLTSPPAPEPRTGQRGATVEVKKHASHVHDSLACGFGPDVSQQYHEKNQTCTRNQSTYMAARFWTGSSAIGQPPPRAGSNRTNIGLSPPFTCGAGAMTLAEALAGSPSSNRSGASPIPAMCAEIGSRPCG